MLNRKKQKIIIVSLCALIIGMVVGYASLNQLLNINGVSGISGDFKIEFTKIEENTMVNATTITKGGVGSTTANFTVDLEKPGSSALYDLTVENKGTLDAVLTSIEGLDESNLKDPVDIIYTVTGIKEGDSLNTGAQKKFQVQVTWKASATSIPTTSKSLILKLNYEQGTGSGEEEKLSASDYLIKNNLNTQVTPTESGLVAIGNNGEIVDSTSPREYRYIGPNPDNYVHFNNELWRIIGIFNGQLKLIRKDSLGNMEYNDYGNDWGASSLSTYLNAEYLQGIDHNSVSIIDNHLWTIGGVDGNTTSELIAQSFYESEHGPDAMLEWSGKIALMYPSDYGFATSGGASTNRNTCLGTALYSWNNAGVSDCKNNNWLYDSLNNQWTFTSNSNYINAQYYVLDNGGIDEDYVSYPQGVRPTLYLDPSALITSGTGTETDPFILG